MLLQRDNGSLDALARGPLPREPMTSMATYAPFTIEALQTATSTGSASA
jgi:hypothetical protein